GQGKDNARDYLKEHQELRQSVEAKIREKLMNDGSDTE
ncbi:MAG: DNA recombination/repair protein RecA, partial [Candidatus Thioglobus sp.]|nr:DNA recombination/repair protein RecA [Candidatus Thioglobus sp.]